MCKCPDLSFLLRVRQPELRHHVRRARLVRLRTATAYSQRQDILCL